MDIEAAQSNERFKAIATMCDNAALALFIAGILGAYRDVSLFLLLDFAAGFTLMWVAWHTRGLLQSEE